MSDQIRISDTGELETVPTTWDGEPLYSPSTVAEGLFDPDAFKQIRGQTSMSTDEPVDKPIRFELINHYGRVVERGEIQR